MAAGDRINIMVEGTGGHGAIPHISTDSVVATAALVGALQTLAAREVSAADSAVLSITQIHSGGSVCVCMCMCAHVCVYVCVCTCVCARVRVRVCARARVRACARVCVRACACVCVLVRRCIAWHKQLSVCQGKWEVNHLCACAGTPIMQSIEQSCHISASKHTCIKACTVCIMPLGQPQQV